MSNHINSTGVNTCIVCGNYVPEGRLICTDCEHSYTNNSKKSNVAIEVLNRINGEGKLDHNDYIALLDAITSIS